MVAAKTHAGHDRLDDEEILPIPVGEELRAQNEKMMISARRSGDARIANEHRIDEAAHGSRFPGFKRRASRGLVRVVAVFMRSTND